MAKRRIRKRVLAAVDDVELLIRADSEEFDVVEALNEGRDDLPMWALPALVFLWTRENKALSGDLEEFFDPDTLESNSAQVDMDRRASMFDIQVEKGVRAVFEFQPPDHAVTTLNNKLTVDLGPELSELAAGDLSALPRRRLDDLLRAGELDSETYAAAVKERYERMDEGDLEPRSPVRMDNPHDATEHAELDAFLDDEE